MVKPTNQFNYLKESNDITGTQWLAFKTETIWDADWSRSWRGRAGAAGRRHLCWMSPLWSLFGGFGPSNLKVDCGVLRFHARAHSSIHDFCDQLMIAAPSERTWQQRQLKCQACHDRWEAQGIWILFPGAATDGWHDALPQWSSLKW